MVQLMLQLRLCMEHKFVDIMSSCYIFLFLNTEMITIEVLIVFKFGLHICIEYLWRKTIVPKFYQGNI